MDFLNYLLVEYYLLFFNGSQNDILISCELTPGSHDAQM